MRQGASPFKCAAQMQPPHKGSLRCHNHMMLSLRPFSARNGADEEATEGVGEAAQEAHEEILTEEEAVTASEEEVAALEEEQALSVAAKEP
jgi:hypothetical protein